MTRRVYLYFVVTFLLGVLLGGMGVYYFGWSTGRWHRGFSKERAVTRLRKALDLSDAQVQQVSRILDETEQKVKDLQKQSVPQFLALREEARSRIRQILNADQVKKFDALVKQIDERHRRRGQPMPGQPPPGPPRAH
jgi:Spy/CpxP family protein refolding chaperone